MADQSTCTAWRCGTVTPGLIATCPACGGRTVSSRRIRILGWLLVVLGLFLVVFIGMIASYMYPTLSRPGVDMGEQGRWNGTAEQGRMVLNLFWMIIGLGILGIVGGIWQIATGRRNRVIIVLVLLGGATIAFHTWQTTESLKRNREAEEPRLIVQPPPMAPVNLAAPAPDKPQ